MSVENLLQEMEENKKPAVVLEESTAIVLTPTQHKEIIQLYLEGSKKTDIAKRYNATTNAITKVIESNADLRLETEKRYQATAMARENYRLSETKNKLISFIDATLEETVNDPTAMTTEAKMKVLNSIAALFDKLSITSRLNAEKPSSIAETRKLSIDVDKVIAQLDTNEDKLNFLRGQNTTGTIIDTTAVEVERVVD